MNYGPLIEAIERELHTEIRQVHVLAQEMSDGFCMDCGVPVRFFDWELCDECLEARASR